MMDNRCPSLSDSSPGRRPSPALRCAALLLRHLCVSRAWLRRWMGRKGGGELRRRTSGGTTIVVCPSALSLRTLYEYSNSAASSRSSSFLSLNVNGEDHLATLVQPHAGHPTVCATPASALHGHKRPIWPTQTLGYHHPVATSNSSAPLVPTDPRHSERTLISLLPPCANLFLLRAFLAVRICPARTAHRAFNMSHIHSPAHAHMPPRPVSESECEV
ncbi:hypothetical protein BD413DRAFT_219073 [Trametes elegans]|nr:hypothetical protein BD413DRAFT_219073 [Trametes elegans]